MREKRQEADVRKNERTFFFIRSLFFYFYFYFFLGEENEGKKAFQWRIF
jgi:hypothetical protein